MKKQIKFPLSQKWINYNTHTHTYQTIKPPNNISRESARDYVDYYQLITSYVSNHGKFLDIKHAFYNFQQSMVINLKKY